MVLTTLVLGSLFPFWHTETHLVPFSAKLRVCLGDSTDLTLFIPVPSSARHTEGILCLLDK